MEVGQDTVKLHTFVIKVMNLQTPQYEVFQ
jgi:hypothetical protein